MYFDEIKKRIDIWVLERDNDLTLTEILALTDVLNFFRDGKNEAANERTRNLQKIDFDFQNNAESSLSGAIYNFREFQSREFDKIVDILISEWFDVSEIYSQLNCEFDSAMRKDMTSGADHIFEQRKRFWYPKSLLRGVSKERISFENERYTKDSFEVVLRILVNKKKLASAYVYYCLISGYIYLEYLQFTSV